MNNKFIHHLADAASSDIGNNTKILQYTVVSLGAKIGNNCTISSHCLIESNVIIGSHVTIKNAVCLPNGLRIGDDVYIGPNVSFVEKEFKQKSEKFTETTIQNGVYIESGTTILTGISIGANATVLAGSVVTKSVPANAIVDGNPAKIIGYAEAVQEISVDEKSINFSHADLTPTKVRGVNLHKMPRITDIRGSLTVGEFERSIPFSVKRYFLVFDVPSAETRGEHAHKECHQFLICIRGSCAVVVDDGENRQEFTLNKPDIAIHLPPMTWGIQYKYSEDAMLLVFASHYYDNEDYIRDYSEFKKSIKKSHG